MRASLAWKVWECTGGGWSSGDDEQSASTAAGGETFMSKNRVNFRVYAAMYGLLDVYVKTCKSECFLLLIIMLEGCYNTAPL